MKRFLEKKEQEKQMVEEEQACSLKSAVPVPSKTADSADCSQGREGQLVLQLEPGGGVQPGVMTREAAEIPQLDGEDEEDIHEPEELIKLVYKFEHEKSGGDSETLVKRMKETMPSKVVKDIFVSHREDKVSGYGRKYNVYVTILTIVKGTEKQVKWPCAVNGFLDVTFLGKR